MKHRFYGARQYGGCIISPVKQYSEFQQPHLSFNPSEMNYYLSKNEHCMIKNFYNSFHLLICITWMVFELNQISDNVDTVHVKPRMK